MQKGRNSILGRQATRAQERALEAVCFEELMIRIMEAYRLELVAAQGVFSEEPEMLAEEVGLWKSLIAACKEAIIVNKLAFAKAYQTTEDASEREAIMRQALESFILVYQPGFNMHIKDGDWWADVEY